MKFLMLLTVVLMVQGCTGTTNMFKAWKDIPPPGGCDQCHTVPISTNWQISYKAANVADEQGRLAFQTPAYNTPPSGDQRSPLETKKVEELQCFECHKAPTPAHRDRKGRFHH